MTVLVNAGPWLSVPPPGYGGIENVLAALVPELRARGVRVLLATVGSSTLPVDERITVSFTEEATVFTDAFLAGFDVVADNTILLTIDEAGFIYPNVPPTPSMGADHPVAWYKDYEGGRSFYVNF